MINGDPNTSTIVPNWGHAISIDQAIHQADTLCQIAHECIERSHRAINLGNTDLSAQFVQWANTCTNAASGTCNIPLEEVRNVATEEAEELFSLHLRAQEIQGESEGLLRHEPEVLIMIRSPQQGQASGPCLDAIEEIHRQVGTDPWTHEDIMATAATLTELSRWNPGNDPLPERNKLAVEKQSALEAIMNEQAELAFSPSIEATDDLIDSLNHTHAPIQGAMVNVTTHNPDTPEETYTHWLLYLSQGRKLAQHLDDPYPKDTCPALVLRHSADVKTTVRPPEIDLSPTACAELSNLAAALDAAAKKNLHTLTPEEAQNALATAKKIGLSRTFQATIAANLTADNPLLKRRLLGPDASNYDHMVSHQAVLQIIASARDAGADEEAIYWMVDAVGYEPTDLGVEPRWLDFLDTETISESLGLDPEIAYNITQGMTHPGPRTYRRRTQNDC